MTDLDSRLPDEYDEIFDDLRTVLLTPPSELVARQHLDAMADAMTPRAAPAPLAPRRSRRILASATIGAAVLVGGGIAAATGELPGPLQNAVSRALEPLGLDIPRSETESPATGKGDSDEGSSTGAETTDENQPATPIPQTSAENGEPAADSNAVTDGPATPGNSPSTPPGQSANDPGQSGSAPGQSNGTPGQPSDPGNSESAPGQTGETPGRSATAPGHSDNTNNKPESPPGQAK